MKEIDQRILTGHTAAIFSAENGQSELAATTVCPGCGQHLQHRALPYSVHSFACPGCRVTLTVQVREDDDELDAAMTLGVLV